MEINMKQSWSVVILFENAHMRERVVEICDRLIERSWAEQRFDVTWWSFEMLADPQLMRQSAGKAIEADLILFGMQPEGRLPGEVKDWVESWTLRRGDREGAVVGLFDPQSAHQLA